MARLAFDEVEGAAVADREKFVSLGQLRGQGGFRLAWRHGFSVWVRESAQLVQWPSQHAADVDRQVDERGGHLTVPGVW